MPVCCSESQVKDMYQGGKSGQLASDAVDGLNGQD